jgi:hypothetical protein
MREFKALRGVVIAACMAIGLLVVGAVAASDASADAATFCVKATKTLAKPKHYTGGWTDKTCTAVSGTHEGKYEKIKPSALTEPEQEELKSLLKYVKVEASGVGGKPTVKVSGANVQIVNGEGSTATTNGAGNLVVGYDESPKVQTGSHNVMLGYEQTYTSYGSLLGGSGNTASGAFSMVFGYSNEASKLNSSVSGGFYNKASGTGSSVTGGYSNEASFTNSSVSGGKFNKATSEGASVSGGYGNTASGESSSIFGGKLLTASLEFQAIP